MRKHLCRDLRSGKYWYMVHLKSQHLALNYYQAPALLLSPSLEKFSYESFSDPKHFSLSSSSGWYATPELIYHTPPTSSSNDWENTGKRIFIGSQGCGELRLICGNSHSCSLEGVCMLSNTIVPYINFYMLKSPPSVIIYKRLSDIRLSWTRVP